MFLFYEFNKYTSIKNTEQKLKLAKITCPFQYVGWNSITFPVFFKNFVTFPWRFSRFSSRCGSHELYPRFLWTNIDWLIFLWQVPTFGQVNVKFQFRKKLQCSHHRNIHKHKPQTTLHTQVPVTWGLCHGCDCCTILAAATAIKQPLGLYWVTVPIKSANYRAFNALMSHN